jgi:hypothetical protein
LPVSDQPSPDPLLEATPAQGVAVAQRGGATSSVRPPAPGTTLRDRIWKMVQDGKLIGGGTVGGLLVTSLNGFGIDIGKNGFILDMFYPPQLEAQIELTPENLSIHARNAGRGVENLTFESIEVRPNYADPGDPPEVFPDEWSTSQIRWGADAPQGSALLEQEKATVPIVGVLDYEPEEEGELFFDPSAPSCTFNIRLRFGGDELTAEDCRCGSGNPCSVASH